MSPVTFAFAMDPSPTIPTAETGGAIPFASNLALASADRSSLVQAGERARVTSTPVKLSVPVKASSNASVTADLIDVSMTVTAGQPE